MGGDSYTSAQITGVTDTSDARSSNGGDVDIPGPKYGAWEEPSLEEAAVRAAYGEIPIDIPGTGESGERCGQVAPNGFCDGEVRDGGETTHIHFGRHLCGRKSCSECWSSQWAGPRTVKVVQRLAAARHAEPNDASRRLLHVLVSPPDGSLETTQDMFEARSKAVELAKKHGVRGGITVIHPYRVRQEVKAEFAKAKEQNRDDELPDVEAAERGIWKFLRENDRHWYSQVYWSPHYHVIGLCRDFEPGNSEADDGWVVRNLSTGKGSRPNLGRDMRFRPFVNLHDEEPYNDMIGAVRYLFSHTGTQKGRQSITWFGDVHGTNFNPEEDISGGSWSAIQRRVEELVGANKDRTEEDDTEREPCPVDGCPGEVHHIKDGREYVEQNRDKLSVVSMGLIQAAVSWFYGDGSEIGELPDCRDEKSARRSLFELAGVDMGSELGSLQTAKK